MITIDRIEHGKGYWYRFPTIDFKFQNRGRATAFLWQFAIEVIHAEIDQTPVLDFESDVNAGALLIQVTNNGWGDAYNCHIQLGEPILNLLFSDSIRQYRGTLQSGKEQGIFQLSTITTDAQQFQIAKETHSNKMTNKVRSGMSCICKSGHVICESALRANLKTYLLITTVKYQTADSV